MRVKGSLSKQYTKGDGGHAKGDCRDTRGYKKQRARSIDSHGVSSVDARSRCKKEPGSSSSESPISRRPQLRAPERKLKAELTPASVLRERSPPVSRTHEEAAEPLDLVPWRPPVDDAEATSSHLCISNLVFGTSYVADLADLKKFQNWLCVTPHHCHVILCQTAKSAVAGWLRKVSRGRCEEQGLSFKCVVFVTNRIFLVMGTNFCTFTGLPQVLDLDDATFAVAQIELAPWRGGSAVAAAIVHVLPHLPTILPDWLINKMYDSVKEHRVRCITGTFGLTSKQMSRFAQSFAMATPHAVCQMWRGMGSDKSVPSYTLLLGKARKFQSVVREDLLESAVAVSNNWVSTLYPCEQIMPWWIASNPKDKFRSGGEANDVDLGLVKVKKVDQKRWMAYVHQVLFWCGTSQQGRAAKHRMQTQRTEEGQSKERSKAKPQM